MRPKVLMRRLISGATFGLLASWALAQAPATAPAEPLTIGVESLFVGQGTPNLMVPVRVTVENTGPGAGGTVEVAHSQFQTQFPIELPSGAKKSFVAYVPNSNFEPIRFTLSTNRGDARAQLNTQPVQNLISVLTVDDRLGALQYIKTQKSYAPFSVKPESAPDRAAGYRGMRSVILGEGSERLSDEQVLALRRYALMGGQLIFRGGSGNPTLRDPRWADLLPVTDLRAVTGQMTGLPKVKNAVTLTRQVGRPVAGAGLLAPVSGEPVVIRRNFGIGGVSFWSVDPTVAPLREVAGADGLTIGLLSAGQQSVPFPVGAGDPEFGSPASANQTSESPFDAELPSPGQVFLILGAYLILVVPINFLILRLIKRGELAWVTTPILSLGFSLFFFQFAGNLYRQGLTRSASGILIADPGRSEAYFAGRSQLFFPRGGSYDLKSGPMEAVWAEPKYYGGWNQGATRTLQAINPVDVGQVILPGATVTNLSFHEFNFSQPIPISGTVEVNLVGKNAVEIDNRLGLKIARAYLVRNRLTHELANLKAGRGKFSLTKQNPPTWNIGGFFSATGTYFVAQLQECPAGPQIGTYAPSEPLYYIQEVPN